MESRITYKRPVIILASAIAVIVILAFTFNALLASKADSSSQPSPTPTSIAAPVPTAPITPTLAPTTIPTSTPIPVPVDFTCFANSPYAFTVTVVVDLNDGMSRQEAITVAKVIIEHELTDVSYVIKEANGNESVWSVNFGWEYSSMVNMSSGEVNGGADLGHFFNVIISVQDKTVDYTRCM